MKGKVIIRILLSSIAVLCSTCMYQCTYNDGGIKNKFDQIEGRLSILEKNMDNLMAYISIVKSGKLINDIADNHDGTFTIYFTDNSSVVIDCPKGADGNDGLDGEKGKDGITPDFKIENGLWYVSYDNGVTWKALGSAVSGDSYLFKSIQTYDGYVVIVLIDDSVLVIEISPKNSFSIENTAVHQYMLNANYSNFSHSIIESFAVEAGYRMDFPSSYIIETAINQEENVKIELSFEGGEKALVIPYNKKQPRVSNLIPGESYEIEIFNSFTGDSYFKDSLLTYGQVRMIESANCLNFRDIGGWSCQDGRRVKYGKVFRGAAFTDLDTDDYILFRDVLGIKTEVDLRSDEELLINDSDENNDLDHSVFSGNMLDYYHCGLPLSAYWKEKKKYADVFHVVLNSLRANNPVYIHCAGGADRTGAVIMLFDFLLGIEVLDVIKDYELTSFAPGYFDKNNYRTSTLFYKLLNNLVEGLPGDSYYEKVEYLFESNGVTKEEIREFKEIMIK